MSVAIPTSTQYDVAAELERFRTKLHYGIVYLTETEEAVAWQLITAGGKFTSAADLGKRVLGFELGAEQIMYVHVSSLRKKLGGHVENKKGVGYRWAS